MNNMMAVYDTATNFNPPEFKPHIFKDAPVSTDPEHSSRSKPNTRDPNDVGEMSNRGDAEDEDRWSGG